MYVEVDSNFFYSFILCSIWVPILIHFDFNVRVTKETTDMAHALGVSVEGEIGCLGSLETGTGEKEDGVGAEGKLDHYQLLTNPDEASDFVKATNVDALAIAIGTSHGAYKFSRPPTKLILLSC